MKSNTSILLHVVLLLVAWPVAVVAQEPPDRPHIVWILAEDLGPDLSCYGTPGVHTPHLDRLASEGVRYTAAFTTSPVCSTSRSAMMTGMHQNAIGAHQHRTRAKKPLPAPVRPFPELLQEAGYFTGLMAGRKLDLNFQFRVRKHFPGKDWKEAGDRPFFFQLTFANTHRPWKRYPDRPVDPARVVVPPYYPDTPLVRRDVADGLEEVHRLDARVGKILQRLDDEGLTDRTLVIFIGDHGRCQVRAKQFLYDSGVRVPLILRWPGRLPEGEVRDDLVSAIDVTATVLAAAGAPVPDWMQGRDLLGKKPPRDIVFMARDKMDDTHDAMRACRDRRFKYILNLMPERAYCQFNKYKERQYPVLALLNVLHIQGKLNPVHDRFMQPSKPTEELYDLIADPHETRNLASDPAHARDLERLRAALARWRQEVGDRGVTDEFRRGGWPPEYPTRALYEWEAQLAEWKKRLLP